ncbi:MAG: PLDc_N domain-containing protein [Smithella sp.]|nr:PLDc_N domain-containing protein [Smithella sp.]
MSTTLPIFILFLVLGLVLGLGGTILWIWMIVDCATKEPSNGNDKLIWIVIIVLTHWVGALIYLLVRRPQRIAMYGQ